MGCVVIFNHLVLCILWSNRYQFFAFLGKIIKIFNSIGIFLADGDTDNAGSNVILRENVFLFPGRRLPGPLGTDIIFP